MRIRNIGGHVLAASLAILADARSDLARAGAQPIDGTRVRRVTRDMEGVRVVNGQYGRQGSTQDEGVYPTVGLGLLLIRVVTGIVFFMHGYQKLVDNGISATQQGFDMMGVPLPDATAVVVTFVELIGGAALILGAFTAIVGLILAIDMLSALFIVHIDAGFFALNGGFELVLLLGAMALGVAITGPGQYSVDAMTNLASRFSVRQLPTPSRR